MADERHALTGANAAGEEQAPPAPLGPVRSGERITAIDALRGFALLGILPMNMPFFADTAFAFFNPPLAGGFTGLNYWLWLTGHLLFELKMMAIFSMLFGAGLVVMSARAAAASGRSFAAIYYRRLLWLFLFGMVHAYAFWYGDILYAYALCGLVLYPLRRLRPRTLLIAGTALVLAALPINTGFGLYMGFARENAAMADAAEARGEEPTDLQSSMREAWKEMSKGFVATPEELEAERRDYQEGGWGLVQRRARANVEFQTVGMFFFGFWRPCGLMLIGMALMKWGVFAAARSPRFYGNMALIGYGVGLPIVGLGAWRAQAHGFDIVYMFTVGLHYNYIGSLFVAAGHIGLFMLVLKAGVLRALIDRLAAVGRMALSNYLAHTLICTTIFYGYGLALWGRLDRVGWLMIVLAIWAFQLAVSPWWLVRFRFGPAEWLWRSLTYWRVQPMRRGSPSP